MGAMDGGPCEIVEWIRSIFERDCRNNKHIRLRHDDICIHYVGLASIFAVQTFEMHWTGQQVAQLSQNQKFTSKNFNVRSNNASPMQAMRSIPNAPHSMFVYCLRRKKNKIHMRLWALPVQNAFRN